MMRPDSAGLLVCLTLCAICRADPLVLTGKVMDEAGRPVAGGDVWVRDGKTGKATTTRSAAGGSFRLEFEAGQQREWEVMAVAPGLALGQARYSRDDPKPVAVRLAAEAALRGRVLDSDGKPVEGAEVTAFGLAPAEPDPARPWHWVFVTPEAGLRSVSDGAGRFTLPHVPRGAKADLRVHARGFADWPVTYESDHQPAVGGMADEYTIRLEPAAVVEGTVTRDGKPAAGAPVGAQGISPTTGWAVAHTDEQGRYRLEALGGGTYSVMIDDLPDLVAPAHAPVKTNSGQTLQGIDFQLTPGGLIEGRIIDAETAQPVTGVRAAGYGPMRPRDGGGACFGVDVDQEGRYRLRVAPGRNYIYYQGGAEDYPFAEGANFEIEVAEGQTVQAPDIRLTRAKPLVVLVVGPDGQPVPGALVQAVTEFGFQREADAGGKCEIRGIPPERAAVLLARDPQHTLCGTAVVKPEARGELATVTLASPASVEVRFVDPRGKPLAGARVSAWLRLPEGAAALMPIGSRLAQATSDADGLVRFGDLPGGSTVTLSPEQRVSQQTGWPGELDLRAGETRVLDDITLDLARMGVSGVVMLPDRTPIQGASVWARGVDRAVRTDAEGRFKIGDLSPADPITIVAGSPDGRLWGAEEVVPQWEFEPGIILGKTVRLTARLVGPDGKPVPNRGVLITAGFFGYANNEPPIQAKLATDGAGKLMLDCLVPGVRYQLYVDEPGPNPKTGSLCQEFMPEPDVDCGLGDIAVDKH